MREAQVDGECSECEVSESHAPDCVRGRLLWIRMARDHDLAALAEVYQPRMRALHAEYAEKRAAIWAVYEERVAELKAAA